jgi:hypothetical protein
VGISSRRDILGLGEIDDASGLPVPELASKIGALTANHIIAVYDLFNWMILYDSNLSGAAL